MPLDEAIEVVDPRFHRYVIHNAHLEQLWSDGRWTEGPVYLPAARSLVFSDIPNDRTLRFDEMTATVDVFDKPAHYANGHTLDCEGRMVACEHGGRAVTRIGHHGGREILADAFDGDRLNSPNDCVVHPDGAVWFTDPTYGIDSDYEGHAATSAIGASNVYRIDPSDAAVTAVITDMVQPNGLAFSPDFSTLYVADTGSSHVGADCPPDIRAYPMSIDGRSVAGDGSPFVTCDHGVYDGFRFDVDGNLWTSAGDGVHCYDPEGTLLGRIRLPEVAANVEFGGPKRNRLYICATTSLYAMYVRTSGAALPTLRR